MNLHQMMGICPPRLGMLQLMRSCFQATIVRLLLWMGCGDAGRGMAWLVAGGFGSENGRYLASSPRRGKRFARRQGGFEHVSLDICVAWRRYWVAFASVLGCVFDQGRVDILVAASKPDSQRWFSGRFHSFTQFVCFPRLDILPTDIFGGGNALVDGKQNMSDIAALSNSR